MAPFSLLLALTACGLKTAPVAPESIAPEPVKDLRAVSREGKFLILFKKPSRNVDGSKLTDLVGFKVMRRIMEENGCKTCPEKFPFVQDIDIAHPQGVMIAGERLAFTDAGVSPGMRYEYKVVAYNKSGYEGPEAQRVKFSWAQPPSRPLHLRNRAGDKTVELEWDGPETLLDGSKIGEIKGYNIYRREDGKYGLDPVNQLPVKESRFTDFGLKNDTVYYYSVRALVDGKDGYIEGMSSDETIAFPKETLIEELKGEMK